MGRECACRWDDASRLGTFILINARCAGRVIFQILPDFVPKVAYPLVGLTGLIEVIALSW